MTGTIMSGAGNTRLPSWVPEAARRYLVHTERGVSIRALARKASCHPSTVLRQVRRFENLRDDFLIDEALRHLGRKLSSAIGHIPTTDGDKMGVHGTETNFVPDNETANGFSTSDQAWQQEARRVLRRLCEPGAVLAVAAEMDKAVIVRDRDGGQTTRTAVVDRDVAQALALKDWISCTEPGRVARYHITAAGRAAFSRMMAEAENAAQGFAEAQTAFVGKDGNAGTNECASGRNLRRHMRMGLADSPLTALARRRDREGSLFLSDDLVAAGERLREDFELAQMGAANAQNWEAVLSGDIPAHSLPVDVFGGSNAARDRVVGALRELGPGLGDVALRCCCLLEGLETAEKRMGWSARSGKIVLRIALQRLKRHYDDLGAGAAMIG